MTTADYSLLRLILMDLGQIVSIKYHCCAPEHGGGCGRAAADGRAWLCRAPALSPGHQALAGQSGDNLGHVEAAACNLEAWVHIPPFFQFVVVRKSQFY